MKTVPIQNTKTPDLEREAFNLDLIQADNRRMSALVLSFAALGEL